MKGQDEMKKAAVKAALDYIKEKYFSSDGDMVVGFGTGTTVSFAFSELAKRRNIIAVPTSGITERAIRPMGVPVKYLSEVDGEVEFDIDGADEVDPRFNLIKGGGGCHTIEKEVAKRSKELIIVVDESKLVDYLGQKSLLPVEVERGKVESVIEELRKRNIGTGQVRLVEGQCYITDRKNIMMDVKLRLRKFGDELVELEREINSIDGVLENGIFAERRADIVFVGKADGSVEVLKPGGSQLSQ
jgi:ribose 5-phosphate isomerase A